MSDAVSTITIQVELYATFRKYHRTGSGVGSVTMEVPEGTTVGGLALILGMPEGQPKLPFIDNRHMGDDRVILDGERVAYFPPIAGG